MAPRVDRDDALRALERILASEAFQRAGRSSGLLRFLVHRTLEGQGPELKEYFIGTAALGRPETFDPRTDTIVRAEASRLRGRLERYYAAEGRNDPLTLVLPKGSYAIEFGPVPPPDSLTPHAGARTPRRRVGSWVVPLAAAVVLALVAVAADYRITSSERGAPVTRFDVELRSDGTLGSVVGTDVVLTPDGRRVVYAAVDASGLAHLYTRRLDEADARVLSGSAGARSPFVSPDGRWAGFWADGRVLKAPLDGGDPVVLCESADLAGASWGEDGWIVAALNSGGLWRVPEVGGTPVPLLDLTSERAYSLWPQVVDRELVVYTVMTGDADSAAIEALTLPGGRRTTLVRGATFGRVLSNGYLTFVNQGTMYAVRFDRRRLAVEGPSVPVLQDVTYSRTFGFAQVDVARSGLLVYRRDAAGGLRTVEWIDQAGRREPVLPVPARYLWPRLSPDGRRLAVSVTDGGRAEVRILDLVTSQVRRLQTAAADHSGLTWSPAGDQLLYGGTAGLFSIATDERAEARPLGEDRGLAVPWSISPDGRLAYQRMSPTSAFDLWTARLVVTGNAMTMDTPALFFETPAMDTMPSWSPDGRWMAYVSRSSGSPVVWVRRFPDDGTATQVSAAGGSNPRWSARGRRLFFRAIDGTIMVSAWEVVGDRFVPGPPQVWARPALADTGVLPGFDVAADGDRVVALVPAGADRATANHATFVLNFADDVRRRVESGR